MSRVEQYDIELAWGGLDDDEKSGFVGEYGQQMAAGASHRQALAEAQRVMKRRRAGIAPAPPPPVLTPPPTQSPPPSLPSEAPMEAGPSTARSDRANRTSNGGVSGPASTVPRPSLMTSETANRVVKEETVIEEEILARVKTESLENDVDADDWFEIYEGPVPSAERARDTDSAPADHERRIYNLRGGHGHVQSLHDPRQNGRHEEDSELSEDEDELSESSNDPTTARVQPTPKEIRILSQAARIDLVCRVAKTFNFKTNGITAFERAVFEESQTAAKVKPTWNAPNRLEAFPTASAAGLFIGFHGARIRAQSLRYDQGIKYNGKELAAKQRKRKQQI